MNKEFNSYFDHTLLKPDATESDIKKLCAEAKEHSFYAVCVNSSYVALAAEELTESSVKVACVVGFPLGTCLTEVKGYETDLACSAGADEIDMVIHVGALKEKRFEYVLQDIEEVVSIAHAHEALVKVILETCLLTKEEIKEGCRLAAKAGAAFVKTSTGFSSGGAEASDVKLMKEAAGDAMQVKAAGGIRDLATALEMVDAGADRLGASASVEILLENERNC